MGFKGNLATLSLAEIFQTLGREKSTGVLRIQAPEGQRFVEIQNGVISIAGRSAGRIMLGDLLLSRGLLDDAALKQALQLQKESTRLLGQVLIESGIISKQQLEDALRFQIEEEVCELFTLHKGDFDFLEGSTLDARIAPAGGMVRLKLNLSDLLVEAGRRAEEWKTIEQRIPNQAFLFQLSAEAAKALAAGEGLSPEGVILLRLVQAHRTVESIVQKGCLGRFNTNRMLLELWDVGLVEAVPPSEYLSVAREHLRAARLDEAQRLAEAVLEKADPAQKEQTQALLAEVAKARKPGSGTASASLNVSAEAKVRSEIIRRAPANLILKKQRAVWPLVLVIVLVLGGLGAAAYWQYGRGGSSEYTLSRRQLEETSTKAQELIAAGKFAEGLQLLRDFRTLDSEVRKLANELFERRQRDVEAMLLQAITRFSTACKGGAEEEQQAAAEGLANLIDISVLTPHVEAKRAKARVELDAYLDSQRAVKFEQKLKDIENSADKSSDARVKAYADILAEGPPESVAVRVRAEVSRGEKARAEAAGLLQQGRALRDAGDIETAKFYYGRAKQAAPASTLAAAADTETAEANQAVATQQAEYEKIEALLTQNKSAEARAALIKFLDSKPCHALVLRALPQLQALQPADEADLAAGFKAAAALYDKDPPDAASARKKIIELAEKAPYAKSSRAATLKVEFTSEPAGATVTLNGKAAGETRLKLQVPVLGLVRIGFTKEGCRPEEVVANGLRDERLTVALNRIPTATVRLPVPARFGLAFEAEQLVLGGPTMAPAAPPELVLCARQDLKVQRRIKLPRSGPSTAEGERLSPQPAVPSFVIYNGEAFVPGQDSALVGVNLSSGAQRRIELGAPPTSSPAFFDGVTETAQAKGRMLGLATQLGYECYLVEGGKMEKHATLAGADKPAPRGAAFDGELFFIPRGDGALYAVNAQNGSRKWSASLDSGLCGPPALFPFVPPNTTRQGPVAVAVATLEGRVAAFDVQSGTVLWRRDTGSALGVGLASAGAGFVVPHSDGTVELLPSDKKGAAAWTVKLPGESLLTPLVVRDQTSAQGKAIALCIRPAAKAPAPVTEEPCVVVLLAADSGVVLWRAALSSTAVALAADTEHLYVSTENAELYVFDLK